MKYYMKNLIIQKKQYIVLVAEMKLFMKNEETLLQSNAKHPNAYTEE